MTTSTAMQNQKETNFPKSNAATKLCEADATLPKIGDSNPNITTEDVKLIWGIDARMSSGFKASEIFKASGIIADLARASNAQGRGVNVAVDAKTILPRLIEKYPGAARTAISEIREELKKPDPMHGDAEIKLISEHLKSALCAPKK